MDWRLIFVINLPLALIAAIATRRVVPEVRHPDEGHRPDLLGAVLLVIGVPLIVLCVTKGSAWGWGSPDFTVGLVVALGFLVGFVRRCATHPAPVIELSLLSLRPFAVANAVMLVFYIGFGAILLGIVLFLTDIWHISSPLAGAMFAASPGTVAIISPRVKSAVSRFGARTVATVGCLCGAAGAGWWAWRTGAQHHFALDFLPGLILTGFGVALAQATLYGVVANVLPPSRFGTGTGILNTARQIAIAIGVAILVAILGESPQVSGFHTMFKLIVVLDLIAAAVALVLPGRAPRPAVRSEKP